MGRSGRETVKVFKGILTMEGKHRFWLSLVVLCAGSVLADGIVPDVNTVGKRGDFSLSANGEAIAVADVSTVRLRVEDTSKSSVVAREEVAKVVKVKNERSDGLFFFFFFVEDCLSVASSFATEWNYETDWDVSTENFSIAVKALQNAMDSLGITDEDLKMEAFNINPNYKDYKRG